MLPRDKGRPVALIGAVALAIGAASARAQSADPAPAPFQTESTVTTVRVPSTSADHRAIAESYRQKVAAQRAEVALHRKMKDDYRKSVIVSPKGPENRSLKRMEKHCDGLIALAKREAETAERFVQYHEMRAEELDGYPLEMFRASAGRDRIAEARPDEHDGD